MRLTSGFNPSQVGYKLRFARRLWAHLQAFQSLTGRLQTPLRGSHLLPAAAFQSLTGRLQTGFIGDAL